MEAYEELNARLPLKHLLKDTDIFCLSLMTSNAPRGYELADHIHKHSNARVIMGGMHPTWLPEEALQHADQVIVGEGEKVILDVVEGRLNTRIVQGISLTNVDEAPFPDYSILKTPCVAANVISTRGCPTAARSAPRPACLPLTDSAVWITSLMRSACINKWAFAI